MIDIIDFNRNILRSNYLSTNHKDFLPYSMPSGKETLRYLTNQQANETNVSKVFSVNAYVSIYKCTDRKLFF